MFIQKDLYNKILQSMPIPCVDLLVLDQQGYIMLIKRSNEPVAGQWWFPGGRVHYKETRIMAAVRKLKQECGLEAVRVQEANTYDVILDMPGGFPRHGITTIFHMEVSRRGAVRLDNQSIEADWRPLQIWLEETLHSFVKGYLEKLDMQTLPYQRSRNI